MEGVRGTPGDAGVIDVIVHPVLETLSAHLGASGLACIPGYGILGCRQP